MSVGRTDLRPRLPTPSSQSRLKQVLSIGTKVAKNGKTISSGGLSDLASEVLKHVKRRPFDVLQLVVVHPREDGTSVQREYDDDYFIRYFSFDDDIWKRENGWIHDGILNDVGPAYPNVKHMLVNLRVSGYKYFPDEEPFSLWADSDGEDEGDAYEWAQFVQSAYDRKDAENRPLETSAVCSSVTHVLTVINITRAMKPLA